jgi:hypothetical protein
MKRSVLTILVVMLVATSLWVSLDGESQASSNPSAELVGCTHWPIHNPVRWTCTGWAWGGTGSYYPYWQHNGTGWFQYGGPASGPFNKVFGVLYEGDEICFKVKDTAGNWSNVDCVIAYDGF